MPTRRARLRRRVYARIPKWIREHDFEVFAAFLCLSAGAPLLVTNEVDAASINATLPYILVRVWAFVLALAPIAIGLGLFMASRRVMAEATIWMQVEAWGLRALAYTGYVYWVAIILVNHLDAFPATQIVLIFSFTCHSRATGQIIKVDDYLLALGAEDARR